MNDLTAVKTHIHVHVYIYQYMQTNILQSCAHKVKSSRRKGCPRSDRTQKHKLTYLYYVQMYVCT